MPNYIIAMMMLLLPVAANAAESAVLNSWLIVAYTFYILVPALLIHLLITIYCHKKNAYRSVFFTTRHTVAIMLVPLVGITLVIFEYVTNISQLGVHLGTFLSLIFIYILLSLLFALPYWLHLATIEEQ